MAKSLNWIKPKKQEAVGGGTSSEEFSFVKEGYGIKEIIVSHAENIDSINLKCVDSNGNYVSPDPFFGGRGGTREPPIVIDWPNEYLTKISGTYGDKINSISFQTNLKTYGPYGSPKGTPYELFEKDHVIVGLHGRAWRNIEALGVYTMDKESVVLEKPLTGEKHPAVGGNGGSEFDFVKEGTGIFEITVYPGDVIDAIKFKRTDATGNVTESDKFGGDGGRIPQVITISWPSDYLVKVSGTLRTMNTHTLIGSLSFETNAGHKFGPYGAVGADNKPIGIPFQFFFENKYISGFHGRSGRFLEALGVYVKDKPTNPTTGPTPPPSGGIIIPVIEEGKTMDKDLPRNVGPWGGNNGKPWDDGRFAAVKQIDVHVTQNTVRAIEIRYQSKVGNSIVTKKYGSAKGESVCSIKDVGTAENYLVGIAGYYGPLAENDGSDTIRSLSFYTNKGKYGPFGKETGTFFSYSISNGKIVGFNGRSGEYLDAIGINVQYS